MGVGAEVYGRALYVLDSSVNLKLLKKKKKKNHETETSKHKK